MVKNPPVVQETWVRKITPDQENALEKGMAISPVLLLGGSHGQRSLVGYSPWGHKESDTTEPLTHTHTGWQSREWEIPTASHRVHRLGQG